MSRRLRSKKRGSRGSKATGGRQGSKSHADGSPDAKRVRFQSPPTAGPAENANVETESADAPDFGLSISGAGNRFTVLQDVYALPETAVGEVLDSDGEPEDGDESGGYPVGYGRPQQRSDAMPSPTFERLVFPDVPLGEESESGTDETDDRGASALGVSSLTFDSFPSVAVGEGADEVCPPSPEPNVAAISYEPEGLPFFPLGIPSHLTDEESSSLMNRRADRRASDDVPEVIVEPASSPVRAAHPVGSHHILERLFDGSPRLDFMHDSASPPPSTEAPSLWNTPLSAVGASLPTLSPVLRTQQGGALTADDHASRVGLEKELTQAYAEKEELSAEIEGLSAAETVARKMQEMPLDSLPQHWNTYQCSLSLRAHQARGMWATIGERGEDARAEQSHERR